MPTTLYHLNPETERIGVCRAEKSNAHRHRGCPFGSERPHFGTKEEAQSYYENELETEYGLFGEGSSGQLSLKRDAVRKRLNLLSDETLNSLIVDRWRHGGWTPRDTEQQMANDEPFYVNYTNNQEITLDLDHPRTQATFTKGACSILAAEVHRVTGWPMTVFTAEDAGSSWTGHVAVKLPDGRYLDATGITEEPLRPYGATMKNSSSQDINSEAELIELVSSKDKRTANSGLPLLERFALAKLTYDLLDSEDLLED